MTLIYFTKVILTPSEETDQVWHTHQTLTIEYRNFCMKTYNRFIDHSPTVGGNEDFLKFSGYYEKTLEFYHFIFKKCPPRGIWPPKCCRFSANNVIGSWYSLLRIYQSIIRILEVNHSKTPNNLPTEIMNSYFYWTGRSLFTKKSYKVDFNRPARLKTRDKTCYKYWNADGCAIEYDVAEN